MTVQTLIAAGLAALVGLVVLTSAGLLADGTPEAARASWTSDEEVAEAERRCAPLNETSIIAVVAGRYGVPAAALAALRVAENGGLGREFGVLSVPAPTFHRQAEVAAESFRNAEGRYRNATGLDPYADGRYTDAFLRFFSARWAPIGAANDPDGLNAYHAENLIAAYARFA